MSKVKPTKQKVIEVSNTLSRIQRKTQTASSLPLRPKPTKNNKWKPKRSPKRSFNNRKIAMRTTPLLSKRSPPNNSSKKSRPLSRLSNLPKHPSSLPHNLKKKAKRKSSLLKLLLKPSLLSKNLKRSPCLNLNHHRNLKKRLQLPRKSLLL